MNLSSLSLSSLIDSIEPKVASVHGSPTTKTAAAKAVNADKPVIDAAVGAALQSLGAAKTAAETTATQATLPVNDLQKIAEEQIETEKQAEMQHAYMLGMAMSDGFAAGLSQHKTAAEKVASENTSAEDLQLLKLAKEDPETFLQWVQQGYEAQMSQSKQAEETAYTETYNRTIGAIHKIACDHYLTGYNTAAELIRELAAS